MTSKSERNWRKEHYICKEKKSNKLIARSSNPTPEKINLIGLSMKYQKKTLRNFDSKYMSPFDINGCNDF